MYLHEDKHLDGSSTNSIKLGNRRHHCLPERRLERRLRGPFFFLIFDFFGKSDVPRLQPERERERESRVPLRHGAHQ